MTAYLTTGARMTQVTHVVEEAISLLVPGSGKRYISVDPVGGEKGTQLADIDRIGWDLTD